VIDPTERAKLLAIPMCGERVLMRLEAIGIRRLADLREHDAWDLMQQINIEAGRPIWRAPRAIAALENLIAAARQEAHATEHRSAR
jgi:nucleotidyltransferase/DNA polymerase involved in DNA repair